VNNQELTPFQELFSHHEESEVMSDLETLIQLMLLFNEMKLLPYTWIWFIEGSNKLVSVNIQMCLTQSLFEKSPDKVRDFIYAVDPNGRVAINIAASAVVEVMEKFLLLCGRFEIQNLTPLHRSATSVIYYANDYRFSRSNNNRNDPAEDDDEDQFSDRHTSNGLIRQNSNFPQSKQGSVSDSKIVRNSSVKLVILKFMYNYESYQRELQIRENLSRGSTVSISKISTNKTGNSFQGKSLNPFIKSIISYTTEENNEYKEGLLKYSFNFPYCIVMPAAERNLKTIIDSENIAGKDWDIIYDICKQIAKGVQFLHQRGIIHGDLKPLNIVRINSKYKLIDFDASVKFLPKEECQYACVKYSSAYLPPEYLFFNPATKRISIKDASTVLKVSKQMMTTEKQSPINEYTPLPYELVKASPAHDVWSLGCILYQLFTDEILWRANGSDNIIEDELIKLYNWDMKENESSSPNDGLKRKLLKSSKINDRYRLNLLEQLLSDISFRSKLGIDYILAHPYFNNLIPAVRLPGEEAHFDCFISYRVIDNYDAHYSNLIYHALRKDQLVPWYDKECIKVGESWEKQFCRGLIQSKTFIPLISRQSIQDQFSSYTDGDASFNDNVLLEFYLALELKERKLISKICPILIGDCSSDSNGDSSFSDYFSSKCFPTCHDVVIKALEKKVVSILEAYSLGTPMITNCTVANLFKLIISSQGIKIVGKGNFENFLPMIVTEIQQMVSNNPEYK
jgi:serine/threonine protein kinase